MKYNENRKFHYTRRNDDSPRRINLNPSYMSPEWIEDYRMWYENWRRDCWNERFRQINSRDSE